MSEPESQPWLKKSFVGRPANGCRVCYVGMRIDPTTNPRGQKVAAGKVSAIDKHTYGKLKKDSFEQESLPAPTRHAKHFPVAL